MNQPAQSQNNQPGVEREMNPAPVYFNKNYLGSQKLKGKTAFISGGDSGIGRAVACYFACEGADVVIQYLNEEQDAQQTREEVESRGQKCWIFAANLQDPESCHHLAEQVIAKCGTIDILVNNAAEQHPQDHFENISCEQMENTFKTNFFAYFYMTKAFLPFLKPGSTIINTTSVTAFKGSSHLIDYSSTKGAIVSFTRSLSQNLVEKNIRVNGVAPGPIWTPLIPATFSAEEVAEFGNQVPMKRAGQPCEVAPSYVFLASEDSSYMTGQILHPNGGVVIS